LLYQDQLYNNMNNGNDQKGHWEMVRDTVVPDEATQNSSEPHMQNLSDAINQFRQVMQGLDSSVTSQSKQLKKLSNVLDSAPVSIDEKQTRSVVLPNLPHHREDRVRVYIHVTFLRLGDIDTVKECFHATVQVESCWHEPKLDHLEQIALDAVNADGYWNPYVSVENVLGEPKKEPKTYVIEKRADGNVYIHEYQRIKCAYYEHMELYNFPCDKQDLSIKCVSSRKAAELQFLLMSSRDPTVTNDVSHIKQEDSFTDKQEWHLHTKVNAAVIAASRESVGDMKIRRDATMHSAQVTRIAGFYLWNLVLIMIFITSLAFSTFSIPVSENRMIPSFTLMLTMVTFKSAATNSIPKVSYLTILDKYIISSLAFMAAIPAWHAICTTIKTYGDKESSATADHVACGFMACVYLAMQISFVVLIYSKTGGQFAISSESLSRQDLDACTDKDDSNNNLTSSC